MTRPTAKVAVRYNVRENPDSLFEVEGVFTFHVAKTPSAFEWDETDLTDLVGRVLQWWSDEDPPDDVASQPFRHAMTPNVKLVDVTAHQVSPTISDEVVASPDEDVELGALLLTDMHPPQIAVVVGLRTSLEDRRGRGRMFLPAVNDPDFAQTGYTAPLFRQSIATMLALLASRIRGDTFEIDPWVLAVYSRADDESRSVVGFRVASRLGTQRRRMVTPVAHSEYGLLGDELA